MGSIDFATVELWLADRRQAGLGPKMLRECLSVVSLILGFAVKSKALAQNPAAGHEVKVRRRKVRDGDGVLTMQQVHQLVGPDVVGPHLQVSAFGREPRGTGTPGRRR